MGRMALPARRYKQRVGVTIKGYTVDAAGARTPFAIADGVTLTADDPRSLEHLSGPMAQQVLASLIARAETQFHATIDDTIINCGPVIPYVVDEADPDDDDDDAPPVTGPRGLWDDAPPPTARPTAGRDTGQDAGGVYTIVHRALPGDVGSAEHDARWPAPPARPQD